MANTYSRRDFLKLGLFAAGSALTVGLVGCGGSGEKAATTAAAAADKITLVEDGKLTIVTNYGYIPMEWLENGKAKGFDIDLGNKIAEELGLSPNWLPDQKFDTIIPTIKQGGHADISIGSISITDERRKEIDFSDPYMDSNQGVVVLADKKGDFDSTEKLNKSDVKIAAQAGTTGEAWIKETLPNATLVSLDDSIQTMTGVESGLYDACVNDLLVMQYMCENSYTDLAVSLEIPTGEQYGIVVSKDNPALTEKINEVLKKMEDDGSLEELKKKWFGDMADSI